MPKKCPFIGSEQLQTIMFSEDNTSIESNEKFNNSCKIHMQKGSAIAT